MKIDITMLRDYLKDYYGPAMFSGFPAAIMDLADLDSLDGVELCEKAEEMGVDLRKFEVKDC